MRYIQLDCLHMTDKETLHDYIAKELNLPEYYGRNLDALYDCLTELAPCELTLKNTDVLSALGRYGQSLLNVFYDVALDVPDFIINEFCNGVDESLDECGDDEYDEDKHDENY